MKSVFILGLLGCVLLQACTSASGPVQKPDALLQDSNSSSVTHLELPVWNWKFHIDDQWLIQQQSYLFSLPQATSEDQFRQLLKQHRVSLFTLIPKAQQEQAPNALTLVTNIVSIRGQSRSQSRGEPVPATDWLAQQIVYLSQAYQDFEIEEETAWISEQKSWAKVRFSFADPGTHPPVRVQSTFLGMIENEFGFLVAVANPTAEPLPERDLMNLLKEMIQIPGREML